MVKRVSLYADGALRTRTHKNKAPIKRIKFPGKGIKYKIIIYAPAGKARRGGDRGVGGRKRGKGGWSVSITILYLPNLT